MRGPIWIGKPFLAKAKPASADDDEIAELDRRWNVFKAQGSATSNEEVVQWLQTWGTKAFRDWRSR